MLESYSARVFCVPVADFVRKWLCFAHILLSILFTGKEEMQFADF